MLVPPMSSETTLSKPAVDATAIAAIAPAQGPESTVVTGVTLPMRATPPLLCITYRASLVTCSARTRSSSVARYVPIFGEM